MFVSIILSQSSKSPSCSLSIPEASPALLMRTSGGMERASSSPLNFSTAARSRTIQPAGDNGNPEALHEVLLQILKPLQPPGRQHQICTRGGEFLRAGHADAGARACDDDLFPFDPAHVPSYLSQL